MLPTIAEQRQGTFDPDVCDLCGSREWTPVPQFGHGRALRSDRTVVNRMLEKRACGRCGLARSGTRWDAGSLEQWYREEYQGGAPPAHLFHTPRGEVLRSAVFADWLSHLAGPIFARATRALDCGAGSGELIAALAARWPHVEFTALEPGRRSADVASATGLAVKNDFSECPQAAYDVISAIAVVEHTPSPSAFLRHLRALLRPGGHLVLSQPTQDVPSADLAFDDHLFHFGSAHVRQYAAITGFQEVRCEIGHPLMPTYSMHVWQAVPGHGNANVSEQPWHGPPAATCVIRSAISLRNDLTALDDQLDQWERRGNRVAVFGLGETFAIARCYSALLDTPLVCGAVDAPDRSEYASFSFPVVVPERLREFAPTVVLIAVATGGDRVAARIEQLGLDPVVILPFFHPRRR